MVNHPQNSTYCFKGIIDLDIEGQILLKSQTTSSKFYIKYNSCQLCLQLRI